MNYTMLHCHTMLSNGVTNIDSVAHFKQYVDRAKELGMKALAFSEHGSIFHWVAKKKAVEEQGLKYIHAQEFYVTETLEEKIRDNYHLILIAKNFQGVKELNILSSKAFNRQDGSFYYLPRITLDDVINTSDNLIITTACVGGILAKGHKDIKNKFFKFLYKNKHRCFLEIQPHMFEMQIEYNKMLYDLSTKYNIPLLMTTDTHSLNSQQDLARDVLQKSKKVKFDDEDEFDLTFKSYEELIASCERQNCIPMEAYLEAIENTNALADMVEPFSLDYSFKYPKLWGDNVEDIVREKIQQGLSNRGIVAFDNYQDYLDRIEYEMLAFKHNQALDYLLLMDDVISFCKEKNIGVGYGRGSVNGSIIAYLLGLTEMDAIKYNLSADRFMSTARVSLSDIDTDFPPNRIDEVKDYLFNKHGLYCADIITFNTNALKGAIKDVARALDYDIDTANDISKRVELEEETLRQEYAELFEHVDAIQGVITSVGRHACGVVVYDHPLDEAMGMFTVSGSNFPISQINMKEIDALNHVKLDLLKLDTIAIINDTCELAGIERVTPDNMDLTNMDIWREMRDDTTQIFQWTQGGGSKYIVELFSEENMKKLDYDVDKMVTMLSIGNSAIRPAGASYREDLAHGIRKDYNSKVLNDFLEPTLSYLVFQETIIDFLHGYCGFTKGEADIVRRQFAKKTGTETSIPVIKHGGKLSEDGREIIGFIQTMQEKYNMTKEAAEKVIDDFLVVIHDASSYLFSANHSQPYSFMGLACAYLRYYYPLEFLTSSFNTVSGDQEKTQKLLQYLDKKHIAFKTPTFRKSKGMYFFDKHLNAIYMGVDAVKNIGKNTGGDLYALKDHQYNSFVELLQDISLTKINKSQLELLILIGYFEEFGEINVLLSTTMWYNKFKGKKQLSKDNLTPYELQCLHGCFERETAKKYIGINVNALIDNLIKNDKVENTTIYARIVCQLVLLKHTSIINKDAPYNHECVVDVVSNQYGTVFATLYNIKNGTQKTVRVNKKWHKEFGLNKGDIIECIFEYKPAKKKVVYKENENAKEEVFWVDTDVINEHLKMYSKIDTTIMSKYLSKYEKEKESVNNDTN